MSGITSPLKYCPLIIFVIDGGVVSVISSGIVNEAHVELPARSLTTNVCAPVRI